MAMRFYTAVKLVCYVTLITTLIFLLMSKLAKRSTKSTQLKLRRGQYHDQFSLSSPFLSPEKKSLHYKELKKSIVAAKLYRRINGQKRKLHHKQQRKKRTRRGTSSLRVNPRFDSVQSEYNLYKRRHRKKISPTIIDAAIEASLYLKRSKVHNDQKYISDQLHSVYHETGSMYDTVQDTDLLYIPEKLNSVVVGDHRQPGVLHDHTFHAHTKKQRSVLNPKPVNPEQIFNDAEEEKIPQSYYLNKDLSVAVRKTKEDPIIMQHIGLQENENTFMDTEKDSSLNVQERNDNEQMTDYREENHFVHKRDTARVNKGLVDSYKGPEDADKFIAPELPTRLRQEIINALLAKPAFSERRSVGSDVDLDCDNDVMKAFKEQVPMLRTQWLLNGEPLVVKASHMLFRGDSLLTIQDLSFKDTGLYECRVEYGKNQAVTVAIFALHVTSDIPTLFPRETEPLNLDCHSSSLAQTLRVVDLTKAADPEFGCKPCLTTNLTRRSTRQWYFNDSKTSLLPEAIPAIRPTQDTIHSATKTMSGVWWCEVTHVTNNRRWITSWYRVYVKDPPSSLELWWHSILSRPWLVSVISLLLLLMCIGISILAARYAQKKDENLELRWQMMKNRMLRRSRSDTSRSLTFQGSGESTNKTDSGSLPHVEDMHSPAAAAPSGDRENVSKPAASRSRLSLQTGKFSDTS